MAVPRFHCPAALDASAVDTEYELPDAVAHHALRGLRLEEGDHLTLFTGGGGEFAATLIVAGRRGAVVRIDAFDPVERESALAVTLVQGIAANDAMDHAVRRAVELGVAAIQPVLTARSARMPDGERGEKRHAHWRQIVVAACEQCGRNRIPDVRDVVTLEHWLTQRAGAEPGAAAGIAQGIAQGIVLSPYSARSLAGVPAPQATLDLLIGPEGGFAPEEVALAERAGMMAARLGPRVLRTETAALAALATCNALWGDFR